MIFNKEVSKKLVLSRATVLVNDEDGLVERVGVKTFAHRAGRCSYWGILFDKPLSDGTVGVTYNLIRAIL